MLSVANNPTLGLANSRIHHTSVVCHVQNDRTVFQAAHYPNAVSFHEIEECFEATEKTISVYEKYDYFSSQGIDYRNILRYYPVVKGLEKQFKRKLDFKPMFVPIKNDSQ